MDDKQHIIDKYEANEDFLKTATNLGLKKNIGLHHSKEISGDWQVRRPTINGRKKKVTDN